MPDNQTTVVNESGPIYLDNAATSFPKPESVYSAADACLRRGGMAFGRGSHAAGDDAGQMVAVCRQRLAKLLNAESSHRIAFTFNCTDGLNLLLRGILRRGDRILTTTLEHNSVLRPLRQLQSELALDIVHVGFDVDTGLVDQQALESELGQASTRLVVLNHASNVTGVVQPAHQVARLAHTAGALFLLDAAQTVGHLPLDVQDIGIDFLATAGHKGLLGPLGTGLVYVADGREHDLRPIRCGGTGTVSEQLEQPTTMPTRLESGNLNMPGLAGLNAATEWLLEHSPARVHALTNHHCERLRAELSSLPGVSLVCQAATGQNAGIVSFTIAETDSREVATVLDQSFGIQCRAGLHCAPLVHAALHTQATAGTLRFSPGPFTTDAQIDIAIDAVRQTASAFVT